MGANDPISLLTLLPVVTAGLPYPEKLPQPTVLHTLTFCDSCERSCWIGPAQAQLRRADDRIVSLCYFCIAVALEHNAEFAEQFSDNIVSLNPDIDKARRRTL